MPQHSHTLLKNNNQQRGSVIVTILVVMFFLTTFVAGLMVLSKANLARARGRILLLQAQYSAESGADAAIAYFNAGIAYAGTGGTDIIVLDSPQYKSKYEVSIAPGADAKEKIITATGKVYAPATALNPTYTRTIRVTAQRTSATSSTSMASRNVLYVASGVKNITGKDVYVNGFIQMNKNTTNLIAENITVAGKNTGAGNCSIGGTGNLIKPLSFSTPGQTKTQIHVAYNNCISPPGNNSDTNFDVFANETTIGTIKSMYIPWDQYMDSSYTAAGNCNDWTNGPSPRTIPEPAGTKKTHYPDSSSNVATSCGTSGDLNLGTDQYNITDHVHIRANLCVVSECEPTFYNPTSSLKFVFVEGTINFGSLHSAAGSGPIAFVAYGADPASKSSLCPYGGSVFLGNKSNTGAPAIFLLATNGLCLDKSKFGSSPAMGGLAGKNLYVSTNSGTPFDLALNVSFPSSEIPIDLSWRAARYERL